MSYFSGKIKCVVCGQEGDLNDVFLGCHHCRKKGIGANFTTVYDFSKYSRDEIRKSYFQPPYREGLWRHREFLPVDPSVEPVSIGEGNTPLIHSKRLGKCLGLENLYLKNESQNPTWSHKDRLCSVAVTHAKQVKAPVITVATTGNQGASAAAYSAAAGLPCVVFSIPDIPDAMRIFMQVYGAQLLLLQQKSDRLKVMQACVQSRNWYPVSGMMKPVIGSNPFGIDGYKTISFELFDALGELPDYIAVPCAHSDALHGIWKGVQDLVQTGIAKNTPRMISSEVYGSLRASLLQNSEDTIEMKPDKATVCFSISTVKGTQQGYRVLRDSNGIAEISEDSETLAMQQLLAQTEGIYAETASVTILVALKKLLQKGRLDKSARIVAMLSSSGLKDVEASSQYLCPAQLIEPTEEAVFAALKKFVK